MGQPEQPTDLDVTVLDEGRQRLFPPSGGPAGLDETLLDEGRLRPALAPREDGGLPGTLAERYELIGRLDRPAGQAEILHVRVRADGTEAVVKVYHAAHEPDPELTGYLGDDHPHVVRLLEAGPGYQVMRFVTGVTLRERQQAHVRGFDFAYLHTLVEQIAAALIDLHRAKIVHRDVKPANIMAPGSGPLDLTLIDFGIAAAPSDTADWPTRPRLAYQPPGWNHRVAESDDWWALGMTLVELASGEHPFLLLDDDGILDHFVNNRPIDVSGVPDYPPDGNRRRDRLRNLCQGLLCYDVADRWGEEEVGRWLVGDDPRVPAPSAPPPGPAEAGESPAERPFRFLGQDHHHRSLLALAMTTSWNQAVESLFDGTSRLRQLREWLGQFPDDDGARAQQVVTAVAGERAQPGHVRLLRVVRALDPARRPVYRNHVMSRHNLAAIAHGALANDGDNAAVLEDLWRHHLLPGFDSAPAREPGTGGGGDLAGLDRTWRHARDQWPALVGQVDDRRAREHLRTSITERELLAVTLHLALRRRSNREAAEAALRARARDLPVHLPWFDRLLDRPDLVWVATLLIGHATARAESVRAQLEAREHQQDQLRISAAFREWSRRQNRPAALGWAVAGVCAMAVLWIVPIAVSDAIAWAGDATVTYAWIAAAVCLAVVLLAECLLAAEIGGRFHHRYSIPGAAGIALRPLGRWMQRNRLLAFVTILAAGAAIVTGALRAPPLVPVVTTIGHLAWVAHRMRSWRAVLVEEDAEIAEAERRSRQEMEAAAAAEGANS